MELDLIARFQARAGQDAAVEAALRAVAAPSRAEAGCLDFHVYRALREPRRFFIHSRWRDAAAFDRHAAAAHTVRFLAAVEPLVDPAPDITRTTMIL
jgi:quinol monooxygenase YgiN